MPSLRFTHSVVDPDGGQTVSYQRTVTDDAVDYQEYTIPASTTDFSVSLDWASADLKGYLITADNTVLVEVNTTGNNPVTITADEGLVWDGVGVHALGTASITALLFTTTVETVVTIMAIRDNTP